MASGFAGCFFLYLPWKPTWAKTSTASKIYQPKLSLFQSLRKRLSPQSRGDPREHFLPIGTCRTLYARLSDFLLCLLNSGIERLDMLGKKVHLKYGHKWHCASQRKELFFVFLVVLQSWYFDYICMWSAWSRCSRPLFLSPITKSSAQSPELSDKLPLKTKTNKTKSPNQTKTKTNQPKTTHTQPKPPQPKRQPTPL